LDSAFAVDIADPTWLVCVRISILLGIEAWSKMESLIYIVTVTDRRTHNNSLGLIGAITAASRSQKATLS
jgi:hypothetical protein